MGQTWSAYTGFLVLATAQFASANSDHRFILAYDAGGQRASYVSYVLDPPVYQGEWFLANTGNEVADYVSYPQTLRSLFVSRAHGTCVFFGFTRARLGRAVNVPSAQVPIWLWSIDSSGFATADEFSSSWDGKKSPRYIRYLECVR